MDPNKHTEQLEKLAAEDPEGSFEAKKVEDMNRAERRSRGKYYKDLYKKHIKAKPSVNLELEGQEAYDQQMKMQAWATRY